MNAYDLLTDLRDMLGESTASHWSDREILRTINRIQKRIYMRMSMTMGDWFVKKSSSLTPSAGVISIPSDCAKPIYLEEVSSGVEIPITLSVRDRATTKSYPLGGVYADPAAYVVMDEIHINDSSYVTPVYLWYDKKCIDLHAGTAATGSTGSSLIIADGYGHSQIDDYYNNLYVEIVSGTGVGNKARITDYVASSRALTVETTVSTDTVYGMVSLLPDEAYDAWFSRAYVSLLCKAAGVVDEEFIRSAQYEARAAEESFKDWAHRRIKNNIYLRLREGY